MADQRSLWDQLEPEPEPSRSARRAPPPPPVRATPRIMRVTDLNRRVRGLLDADAVLADVWVEGEVSQPSFPRSGHCFFTLKDATASCARRSSARSWLGRLSSPVHGMNVIIHGRVRAYEPQGTYQLYVDSITRGRGRRPPRPVRGAPRRAGSGRPVRRAQAPADPALAAAHRGGHLSVRVRSGAISATSCGADTRSSSLVLSSDAPSRVRPLPRRSSAPFSALYAQPGIDTIILARGGGSLEDLWGFNDERVVRAVASAPVPIIVGVGHESDTTLADFAADLRAPTPSAAAELATPDGTQLPTILNRLRDRASAALEARADQRRRFLDTEARALAQLAPDIGAARQRSADLLDRGWRAVADRLERRRLQLEASRDGLRTLSPLATLERGYAVARTVDGRILRDAATVAAGDPLHVVVARGTVDARVERSRADGTEDLLT